VPKHREKYLIIWAVLSHQIGVNCLFLGKDIVGVFFIPLWNGSFVASGIGILSFGMHLLSSFVIGLYICLLKDSGNIKLCQLKNS